MKNALLSYDPELRKRILVLAIAPGGYIDSTTCGKVIHYRAKGHDFVPLFDQQGLARETARGTVREIKTNYLGYFVPQDKDAAPKWDHGIDSKTYRRYIKDHIDNFKDSGGRTI